MTSGQVLKRGQLLQVEIEELADGGDGMVRIGGMPTFVSGALPGEQVTIRVAAVHEAHARGTWSRSTDGARTARTRPVRTSEPAPGAGSSTSTASCAPS